MPRRSAKQKARAELAAVFDRNGYVRRPNVRRRKEEGCTRYKKGSEVRLVVKSEAELAHVLALLQIFDFTAGRPFAKGRQICLPIYGHEQVSKFIALVGARGT